MLKRKTPTIAILLSAVSILIAGALVFPTPKNTSSKAESAAGVIMIAPGSSTAVELAAGACQLYAISANEGTLLKFSIDKGDLGLSTTILGPTGKKLLEDVSQDFEPVEISFPIQVTGTYTIELRSREKEESRRFDLKVQPLTNVTASDRRDGEARQALAQAEVLQANWMETPLRQSAELFNRAAQLWLSLGDFTNASRATLKSGVVYFYLSKYPEALKRYEEALALGVKQGDVVAQARALSRMARQSTYSGNNDLAQQHVSRALDLLGQTNSSPAETNARGEAFTIEGELVEARGNFKKAKSNFDEALKLLVGDRSGQARVHIFIGYINGSTGNLDKALAEISLALTLSRAANNRVGEGQALTALGLAHSHNDDQNGAIRLHNEASGIFRSIGDRHSEGIANNGLGQAYVVLKDYPLALTRFKQALELFEATGAMNGIAPTNCFVADVYFLSNDPDHALTYYHRCLNLSRSAGMTRIEEYALTKIARIYVTQQRFELALAEHQKIQEFYERIGDRRGLETALSLYGQLLSNTGRTKQAADVYQQALSLSREIGDKDAQIETLSMLARLHLTLEDPEVALPFIEQSVKLIEELRSNVASPEFRTSYFSGVYQHYRLYIEMLARLERLHPGKGFAAKALLMAEHSRARLLLDLVNESRVKSRGGTAQELIDREIELRGLIRAQAMYKMELPANAKDQSEQAEVENQLNELKAEYQQVEAQVRQQNPYLSSLEQLAPISVEQIQHGLRDGETMLEYSLGDERSYLWEVTSASIHMYELPARKTIEVLANEFYSLITTRQRFYEQRDQTQIAEAEARLPQVGNDLSQMLLGQVAEHLGNRRLIMVVEGGLQNIPFVALPVPNAPGTSLLEAHEIVFEPSFSALLAIRNNRSQHLSSPGKLVAVIADPVVNRSDDRVEGQPPAPAATVPISDKEQANEPGPSRLSRLAHASEEADAISAVAPGGTTMVAKGFAASRETAMSPEVGRYQIVHFATHGVVDTEHPELSGIVLTMFDRNGASTNGLMPLHDIYSLDLSAELTVLSACQTALGKDISGEGFVGISHAFMSAGSKSVLASLWKVDDRATAVLMRKFYESMLQKGMSPAAALRAAQLQMMHEKGSNAPYYWAGFVIQGEYTNRIAINGRSWFRVALVLLVFLSLITAGVVVLRKRRRRISQIQSNGAVDS
jgi:CHAT domain-containing protein/tetratricopeptide (TPR) repeat protein